MISASLTNQSFLGNVILNWSGGTLQTITMASSAMLGLAVTSDADGTLGTSTMDNVTALGLPARTTVLVRPPDTTRSP